MKTEQLHIRLSPTTKTAWTRTARAEGRTLASFVTTAVEEKRAARPFLSREDVAALDELRDELRRVGVNVNQIAHVLNVYVVGSGRLPTGEDLSAMQEDLAATIRSIQDFLILRGAFSADQP